MPKKSLINVLEDFEYNYPNCPNCISKKKVVKSGTRKVREETIQIYLCKQCSKKFSDRKITRTSYPPKLILNAITYYNLGHTLDQTIKTMRQKYKTKIPTSTLKNWVHKYKNELPFIKLRSRYKINPDEIIKRKHLQHQQPYLFQINTLKSNIAGKSFPQLKKFINHILEDPKNHLFQNKYVLRCSELAKKIELDLPNIENKKGNLATKMTNLALTLSKTKRDRHQIVEDFFLINDSVTFACEVPVYILKNEGNFGNDLTGHIDIIQVRNNKIHIIDYKPDEKNERHSIQQLLLYTTALRVRTNIDPNNFVCGFFDEKNYYQFYPNLS
jgi:transposase-like protein